MLELTLSGLIMGSHVDTAGDDQSPNVIISNYLTAHIPNCKLRSHYGLHT